MINRQKERDGGKRAQLTGALAETLALAYLQRRYPDTMIRRNPDHDNGTRAYDIEQLSFFDLAREWTGPFSGLAPQTPDRLWEVKAIRRSSKSFLINPKAHRRFLARRARKGASYVFVVFSDLDHSVGKQSGKLLCQYRIREVPAKIVGRSFFRRARVIFGQKKVPYSWIFSQEEQ